MPRSTRRSFPAVVTAYFTKEQDAGLRALAKTSDREVAEIIRAAVDEYLSAEAGRPFSDSGRRGTRNPRYTGARVKPLRFWRPPWGW